MSATLESGAPRGNPPVAGGAGVPADGPPRLLRHPVPVTLIAFACATLAFTAYRSEANGLVAAFFAAVLVVLAATDIERRIIPNRIVIPAALLILLARLLVAPGSPRYALVALGAGAVFLLPNLLGRSWIGMGDVKLIVLMGAGLGGGVVDALMIAFVSTFPFALATLVRGGLAARKTTLPFGPFLAFGAIVILIVPRLVGLGVS